MPALSVGSSQYFTIYPCVAADFRGVLTLQLIKMMFDKTKAMRTAERYLSQGKIHSAIQEFKQVVDHDPKDFGTLNMLGDLYVKDANSRAAVKCFFPVAEHYNKQGFAAKAIAIYNKISRIEPNSVAVSEKLAELYKQKGSLREARSHYATLAEHYQQTGKKTEALAIWEQIALLEPQNTEVYFTIADSYLKEGQNEQAAAAFTAAGHRFLEQDRLDDAIDAFSKALNLYPLDAKALSGLFDTRTALGQGEGAIHELCEVYEQNPLDRGVIALLIDCQHKAGNIAEAEKLTIRLVEIEPASYLKLVEIAKVYTERSDIDASARLLSMASEHMLIGGQSGEFAEILLKILEIEPEHLEALRLLVRLQSWQRDEEAFRDALRRLAEAARKADAVDDERLALSQLVMVLPHESRYAERLREINAEHGFADIEIGESLFDKQFFGNGNGKPAEAKAFFGVTKASIDALEQEIDSGQVPHSTEFTVIDGAAAEFDLETFETVQPINVNGSQSVDLRLQKECESIRFYIDSGYAELAEKAIGELCGEFGERAEISELYAYLNDSIEPVSEISEPAVASTNTHFQKNKTESPSVNGFNDLRSELGFEDSEAAAEEDFETHFNTATAYQEMGLLEQAIREFQDAAGIVESDDGTRRFFSCANMLGHCFMQIGKSNLSVRWYERALETRGLNDDEKIGLWYELACAHEAGGDFETACRYFEMVYAENINFRDVGARMRSMPVAG